MPRIYLLLVFAALFFIIGFLGWKTRMRCIPSNSILHHLSYIVPLVASIYLFIWTFLKEPLLFIIFPKIYAMRNLEKQDINMISVLPCSSFHLQDKNLVSESIIISDRKVIIEIAQCLRSAQQWSPNHPVYNWFCLLSVHLKEGTTHQCMLGLTNNQGTLITFNSEVEQGWLYAEYKSEKLGKILERTIKKETAKQ